MKTKTKLNVLEKMLQNFIISLFLLQFCKLNNKTLKSNFPGEMIIEYQEKNLPVGPSL